MVAEWMAHHYMRVTIVDELVEARWAPVPVNTIQSLYDSMPRGIRAVTIVGGSCSSYWFLTVYAFKFLENFLDRYF